MLLLTWLQEHAGSLFCINHAYLFQQRSTQPAPLQIVKRAAQSTIPGVSLNVLIPWFSAVMVQEILPPKTFAGTILWVGKVLNRCGVCCFKKWRKDFNYVELCHEICSSQIVADFTLILRVIAWKCVHTAPSSDKVIIWHRQLDHRPVD